MKKIIKIVSFSEKKAEKNRSSFLVRKNKKEKHGFSLIEMIISIFIFSILMMMIAGTFAGFYRNYSKQKKAQKDIENAQYILNFMAKRLRTSTIISSPTGAGNPQGAPLGSLDTYDYSQGQCVRYHLNGGIMQYSLSTPADPASPSTSCAFGGTPMNLSSNNINSARVYVEPSAGNNKGKVTIVLYVQQDITSPGQDTSEIPIQSSVSLRQ